MHLLEILHLTKTLLKGIKVSEFIVKGFKKKKIYIYMRSQCTFIENGKYNAVDSTFYWFLFYSLIGLQIFDHKSEIHTKYNINNKGCNYQLKLHYMFVSKARF